MKIIADFFPVLLFFIAYKLYDIYVATAVAIVASILQVSYHGWRYRKVQPMHLMTMVIIVVFGSLTLILQDRTFIMWKPSIINWLFAVVFLGSQFFGKQTLVEHMMGDTIPVPAIVWPRLNLLWVGFFITMGLVNLYVAHGFLVTEAQLQALTRLNDIDLTQCAKQFHDNALMLCNKAHSQENFWVNFKLFGMMGLTLVFAFGQALYLSRYIKETDVIQGGS